MNRPQLSSKITGAMPKAGHPNSVPSSGVEDNSFSDRTKFPKTQEILSKDTMGNKNLTEDCKKPSSKNPGVDKGFLGKAKNDMTASCHSL